MRVDRRPIDALQAAQLACCRYVESLGNSVMNKSDQEQSVEGNERKDDKGEDVRRVDDEKEGGDDREAAGEEEAETEGKCDVQHLHVLFLSPGQRADLSKAIQNSSQWRCVEEPHWRLENVPQQRSMEVPGGTPRREYQRHESTGEEEG